jgi:hypothetical protein
MNTQQIPYVNNLVAYTISAASTIATLGASVFGYGNSIGAVMTAGSVGFGVYSYLSRKSAKPDPKEDTETNVEPQSDAPNMETNTVVPNVGQTRDYYEDDLQPYTDEDLRKYPIGARSYLVMERTQKIREIEARKQVLKGLFKLQNEAKTDELTVQKDIMQHDKVSQKLAVINVSEGKVEKVPVKEIPLISQVPKDNIELEKAKLKVERTRKNPAENSQLVKSSSAPKALQGKRKASEPETPLTVKNAIDLSPTNTPKKVGTTTIMTVKKDVEPPLKKAKSIQE